MYGFLSKFDQSDFTKKLKVEKILRCKECTSTLNINKLIKSSWTCINFMCKINTWKVLLLHFTILHLNEF